MGFEAKISVFSGVAISSIRAYARIRDEETKLGSSICAMDFHGAVPKKIKKISEEKCNKTGISKRKGLTPIEVIR
jgi:hypothetical protein